MACVVSKNSPKAPKCFLAVNKGARLTSFSSTRLRLPVLHVWRVDETPATAKLQAQVKAEGRAALGATVGRPHQVQGDYSHLIIMMHA